MNNTALGAENNKKQTINFISKAHGIILPIISWHGSSRQTIPVRYCWVILLTSFWTNGFMPRRHPIIWHA